MPRPQGRTRERMLDVAETLFQRHGYHGVAVDDVTSALGLQKPNLYNHFRDKNELYVRVRLRILERLDSDLKRALALRAPFRQRLWAVAVVLVKHPHFLNAPRQRDVETFLPDADRDMLFARGYGAVFEPVAALLDEGAAAGDLPLNPRTVPVALEALVALAGHFGLMEPDGPALPGAANHVTALFLAGAPGLALQD